MLAASCDLTELFADVYTNLFVTRTNCRITRRLCWDSKCNSTSLILVDRGTACRLIMLMGLMGLLYILEVFDRVSLQESHIGYRKSHSARLATLHALMGTLISASNTHIIHSLLDSIGIQMPLSM